MRINGVCPTVRIVSRGPKASELSARLEIVAPSTSARYPISVFCVQIRLALTRGDFMSWMTVDMRGKDNRSRTETFTKMLHNG